MTPSKKSTNANHPLGCTSQASYWSGGIISMQRAFQTQSTGWCWKIRFASRFLGIGMRPSSTNGRPVRRGTRSSTPEWGNCCRRDGCTTRCALQSPFSWLGATCGCHGKRDAPDFDRLLDCSLRIDPVGYGKQLEPTGDYIRRYVPELADFPSPYIHEPWMAPLKFRPMLNAF